MKKVLFALSVLFTGMTFAQDVTVDEVVDQYLENIGGKEKLEAIEGMKMTAKVNFNGMDIPLEIYYMKDGRQGTYINFMGMEMYQGMFDGEVLWSTNQMSSAAEKADAEATENMKREAMDQPDPWLNYKEKGYTAEMVGEETAEGVDCYKIKLIKKPTLVDGEEKDNISTYFFDKETMIPIQVSSEVMSGPAAGKTALVVFSDYTEVEGVYFPFSIEQKMEGDEEGQAVIVTEIEMNPTVEEGFFKFPEE